MSSGDECGSAGIAGATAWLMLRVRLRALLREHMAQAALTLGFVALASLAGCLVGWPGVVGVGFYLGVFAYLAPLIVLPAAFIVIWILRHEIHVAGTGLRAPQAWREALRRFTAHYLTVDRAVSFAVPLALTALLLGTYSGWKQAIPDVLPFSWDETFMRLDYALHGGRHPWELLSPVLARPRLVRTWDQVYMVSWFGVMVVMWTVMAAVRPSELRRQFWVANTLTWILVGAVAATAFSSAGPWAFGAVTELDGLPNPFAPFMARLREIDVARGSGGALTSLRAQTVLWDAYTSAPRRVLIGGGISAMPSLHIAMVMLLALVSWRRARWLGFLAGVYLLVMLVGSVLTGMHYAVDGYASIALVAVIWWAAGRLVGHARTALHEPPARDP